MKILEISALAFNKNEIEFKNKLNEMKLKGIKNLHYDVMDNIFVPNTAYNGEHIEYIKEKNFIISVHLMVKEVDKYVDKFLKYPIDYLTFHCEPITIKESLQIINLIKKNNIKAGVAIKPNTNINEFHELLINSDIVTVMGVEPGFGGQKFIEKIIEKLKILRKKYPNIIIQLDGGVNIEVIKKTKEFVNFFVSGSFLTNYQGDINEILNIIK